MDEHESGLLSRFGGLIEQYREFKRDHVYVTSIIKILSDRLKQLHVQSKEAKRRVQIILKREIKEIQNEIDTWKLLLKIGSIPEDNGGGNVIPFSCLTKIQRMLAEEGELNRMSAICDWLESIGERHRPARTTVNYSRTLHAHVNAEIDPDTANRGLTYDELDQAEENIMLRSVWQLLRQGRHKQAEEYCTQCGQAWRAVSIGGGGIPHDDGTGDRNGISGNSSEMWLMWRLSCRRIARSSLSDIEKAVYGYLGGLIEFVLPMCQSWQDLLWACGRHWQGLKTEEVIIDHIKTHNPTFLESIELDFEKLDDRFNSITKILSQGEISRAMQDNVQHQAQINIMAGKYDSVLDGLCIACSQNEENESDLFPLMRFAIHFYLLIDQQCPKEKDPIFIMSQMIEVYISLLLKVQEVPTALRYLSLLSENDGVNLFVQYLRDLEDGDQTELLFGTKKLLPGWMPQILLMLTEARGDQLMQFTPTEEEDWRVYCDFDLPCSDWKIGGVEPDGQFARKGVKAGWKIVKVNDLFVNETNRLKIKQILGNGMGCSIFFKSNEDEELQQGFLENEFVEDAELVEAEEEFLGSP